MNHPHSSNTSRRRWLVVLSFSIILVAAASTAVYLRASQLSSLPKFQLVAEADLASRAYDAEILAQFTVGEKRLIGLFYTLPDAELPYFDLSLIGPGDQRQVILHSEDYRTDQNGGGSWQQHLTPGSYRLALTAEPGRGLLSVYTDYPRS